MKADDGQQYELANRIKDYISSLKVGDKVLIAKMRDNHRSEDFIWDVYEIYLPCFKITQYCKDVVAKSYFKHNTYLIY
jgi:hypothetical protein